jgi:hypothetical protein
MTMTEKILAKHSDNGSVAPGQVRRDEREAYRFMLLGWRVEAMFLAVVGQSSRRQ